MGVAPQAVSSSSAAKEQRLIGVEHGALWALADHLPGVNQLLESSFEKISGQFIHFTGLLSTLDSLITPHTKLMCESDQASYAALQTQISQVVQQLVMGLQFQDRVSQNMVIVINVLNALLNDWPEANSTSEENTAFATHVLEMMKLGEVRTRYLDYLMQHGLIDSPEELGYHPAENQKTKTDEDDIELF